jgi:hypothetical protein
MKKALAVLALVLFAFSSAAQTAKPPVFSAIADFSTTANPNDAWWYGWSHTQGAAFIPFILYGLTCCTGEEGWFGPVGSDPGYPLVVHDVEPPNVALEMAGGPDDEFAIVRWTAPSASTYHIVGVFYGFGSTLSDVHVLRGRFPLFDGSVAGLSTANFNLTAFFRGGSHARLRGPRHAAKFCQWRRCPQHQQLRCNRRELLHVHRARLPRHADAMTKSDLGPRDPRLRGRSLRPNVRPNCQRPATPATVISTQRAQDRCFFWHPVHRSHALR